MRTFRFNQQLECPINGVLNVVIERTDVEILEEYFMYWAQRMIDCGRADAINEENCIQDWIVVHWAWEVPNASDVELKPKQMTQAELERTGQDIRD